MLVFCGWSNSEAPKQLTEKGHNVTLMGYLGVIPLNFAGVLVMFFVA